MFTLNSSLLNALRTKVLISILVLGAATPVVAHTYFFGVSEININIDSKHLEIIHQFTAHDIENTIAEIKQIHFSAEHPKYDQYIQDYFEQHFTLTRHSSPVELNWIGFEIRRGQLFAYQESNNENYLANLMVKNTILVDTYAKQINTVNYQDLTFAPELVLRGSLTFNTKQGVAKIGALASENYNSNKKQ